MSFRLVPKSVTLNELERRNSPKFAVAFETDTLWKYLCVLRSGQSRQKYYIDVRSYDGNVCFCEE